MSATGKGRLLRSPRISPAGLRPATATPLIESTAPDILADFFWGGLPPDPTRIPYGWLTPPARFRSDQPRNLAEVGRVRGATARAFDRASLAAVGERPFAASLDTATDADMLAYARWLVGAYTAPRQRMPQLKLNLTSRTEAECWLILEREIGDRISITGAPASTLTAVTDTYTRAVPSGWGSADTGQAWTTSGGSASDYSVNTTRGTMALTTTVTGRTASLANIGPDLDVTVYITPPLIAGGAQYEQKLLIRNNGSNWYETNVQYQTSGLIDVYLVRGVTVLSAIAGYAHYELLPTFGVRMQAFGPYIRQKVWNTFNAEPPGWTAEILDTTLPGSSTDSVVLVGDRITGNTDGGLVVQWDNLSVSTPNATGWPDGVTELVIEGIAHSIDGDVRNVVWNTAPVIGATPGVAGPWFRADQSRTDTGSDLLAF